MEEKTISYYAHEGAMARMERSNVRAWTICVILIIAFLGSNAGWLYYECQYEDKVTTIEAEQDGSGANYISGGDLSFGSEGKDNN